MIIKVTPEFTQQIDKACSDYKRAWKFIQKNNVLQNEVFNEYLRHVDKLDAISIYNNTGLYSVNKWKLMLPILKKLSHKGETLIESNDINDDKQKLVSRVEILENQVQTLANIIKILRDELDNIITQRHVVSSADAFADKDAVDFMEALDIDKDDMKYTPEQLEFFKTAKIDEFEHMIKFNEAPDSYCSKGIKDTHVIRSNKNGDISSEDEVTTSIVYDTSDPTTSKREVELREAKKLIHNLLNENDNSNHSKSESIEERKKRWIDAVHKSRIQKNFDIDVKGLQKGEFDYEDPNDTIFE